MDNITLPASGFRIPQSDSANRCARFVTLMLCLFAGNGYSEESKPKSFVALSTKRMAVATVAPLIKSGNKWNAGGGQYEAFVRTFLVDSRGELSPVTSFQAPWHWLAVVSDDAERFCIVHPHPEPGEPNPDHIAVRCYHLGRKIRDIKLKEFHLDLNGLPKVGGSYGWLGEASQISMIDQILYLTTWDGLRHAIQADGTVKKE